MKTRLTEIFGIELPIFAFSHCRDVASTAGGMGVLGVSSHSPEQVERELAWIDTHIDGKPYGVDVLMPGKHESVAGQKLGLHFHIDLMHKLANDAGVAQLPVGEAERLAQEQLNEINMTPEEALTLLENLHRRGIKVGSLVGRLDHACHQIKAGVDVLIVQGTEAGGHISTVVLWPQVIDAVAPSACSGRGRHWPGSPDGRRDGSGRRRHVVRLDLAVYDRKRAERRSARELVRRQGRRRDPDQLSHRQPLSHDCAVASPTPGSGPARLSRCQCRCSRCRIPNRACASSVPMPRTG